MLTRLGTVLIGLLLIGLVLDSFVFPLPYDALSRPHAQLVYSRQGNIMGAFTSPDRYWRMPVELDSISQLLQETVIACEDQWFYHHPGLNPVSFEVR